MCTTEKERNIYMSIKGMVFNTANLHQLATCYSHSNIINRAYPSYMMIRYPTTPTPTPMMLYKLVFIKECNSQLDWKLKELLCLFVV